MKSKIENYLTIEKARELFEIKGSDVVWRVNRRNNTIKAGDIAGYINARGYRDINLSVSKGKKHHVLAHIIAYGLHNGKWPILLVDHHNDVKLDNSKNNLREATPAGNTQNRKIACNSTTGVKGVYCDSTRSKPFRAQIMQGYKHVYREYFTTLEEATVAIRAARTLHHGEFANHG